MNQEELALEVVQVFERRFEYEYMKFGTFFEESRIFEQEGLYDAWKYVNSKLQEYNHVSLRTTCAIQDILKIISKCSGAQRCLPEYMMELLSGEHPDAFI